MAAAKKKPFFRRLRTKIKKAVRKRLNKVEKYVSYKWILPRVYKKSAREPIDEKLVVFADARDRDMPDNFLGLYAKCKEAGYRCEFLSGRQYSQTLPHWRRKKWKYQIRFIRLFARCKVLFLVDFFPLAYICQPREGTQVVQLWHACGVMKKIGYSALDKPWGMSPKETRQYPPHTTYTLVCASSHRPKETFEDAFRCDPDIVKPIGCPRTDIYFDKKFQSEAAKKVRSSIPEIGNRKIILYAPTYRGNNAKKAHTEFMWDIKTIAKELGDEYVLLVKFHPFVKKRMPESQRLRAPGFVFDVTEALKPEEALCAADILISDYSTILFEYMLLERPIISYIYDIDSYIKDRGLYFPYDQLAPGPYVFDSEELLEKLKTVDDWFDIERIRWFKNEFMSGCDGHSTERVFNYVFHPELLEERWRRA